MMRDDDERDSATPRDQESRATQGVKCLTEVALESTTYMQSAKLKTTRFKQLVLTLAQPGKLIIKIYQKS